MIAVTYRSDELHRRHPLRPLLTSWERDRSINRVDLSRFSRDEVAALPASIGGIALGSLVAPVLVSAFGQTAALLTCGAVVTGYCAVLWRARPTETTMQAAAAPLPGAPTVPASARRAGPCRWPAPRRCPRPGGGRHRRCRRSSRAATSSLG